MNISGRRRARARACSNIAFVKYWGNTDHARRLPANPSLSMNLAQLHTTTTVEWADELAADALEINGAAVQGAALQRVSRQLNLLRQRLDVRCFARVQSQNNFPMGTGIASSASSFAALTVAAAAALDAALTERQLSALARRGSGSAARSVPGGYVEWLAAADDGGSYARTFAAPAHWALADVIALVSRAHKRVGSTAGHATADTSVLQKARLATADERLQQVKQAVLKRDFATFAQVIEEDSNLMHAVMMTSRPPLFYWQPASLTIMQAVRRWREEDGLRVCYTLDAGPNVHCICAQEDAAPVKARLRALIDGIELLEASVGGAAQVLEQPRACTV